MSHIQHQYLDWFDIGRFKITDALLFLYFDQHLSTHQLNTTEQKKVKQ